MKSLEKGPDPEPAPFPADSLRLPCQGVEKTPEVLLFLLEVCLVVQGELAGTEHQGRKSLSDREEGEGKSMSLGTGLWAEMLAWRVGRALR